MTHRKPYPPPDDPFHPAYGLTDELRERILDSADEMGVAEAARSHNVSPSAIYSWRLRMRPLPRNPER